MKNPLRSDYWPYWEGLQFGHLEKDNLTTVTPYASQIPAITELSHWGRLRKLGQGKAQRGGNHWTETGDIGLTGKDAPSWYIGSSPDRVSNHPVMPRTRGFMDYTTLGERYRTTGFRVVRTKK
jgi:hypothetical protein